MPALARLSMFMTLEFNLTSATFTALGCSLIATTSSEPLPIGRKKLANLVNAVAMIKRSINVNVWSIFVSQF